VTGSPRANASGVRCYVRPVHTDRDVWWEPGGPDRCTTADRESRGSRPLEDIELVIRAQAGDVPAYEELVRRYQDNAFRAAYLTTRDAEAAQDAVQAAFIKAYYALRRIRPGAPFRPWILKIVTNEARNGVRSAGRRSHYELQITEALPGDDGAPSPEAAALARLRRDTLVRAVNALPEKDQQAIAYRYFLELSEAEMADALGCARGTVKSRLSRALGRLRKSLSGDRTDPLYEEANRE
jgi:RNA polymerase sigma factor (sigma-70 family)